MFKSSLLFAAFLFTILLVSDKFTQISAQRIPNPAPRPGDKDPCVGKCNAFQTCCPVSHPSDGAIT
ncbi:unnamed protein product [Meloidogyne enterolobii]|uniref:Uncharacterized protein n=1 Tax=Meloidogyne enterolobii TaxID=390850 RepID=A0ACB1AQU9_MELEN